MRWGTRYLWKGHGSMASLAWWGESTPFHSGHSQFCHRICGKSESWNATHSIPWLSKHIFYWESSMEPFVLKKCRFPVPWCQMGGGRVCVTWVLGREVCLPYYDHLRSRLVTPLLSLLLTKIKGCYRTTSIPQLSPTSHPLSLMKRYISGYWRRLSIWSSCISATGCTHHYLPAVLIQQ